MQETKDIKLSDLEFNGEHLFVYSDKFNIFFFFFDHEENKLYKITTDKYYLVEHIDEIRAPEEFKNFTKIKFFKPFNSNGNEYTFIGIVQYKDTAFKFKVDDKNVLNHTEEIVYQQPDGIINTLQSIKSIDINSYIQKKNRIFLVGYDEQFKDYIFAIANIEDDKLEKVYSLSSDYGDIIPFSVNTDVDEGKVYIVGRTEHLDDNDKVEKVKPYFEAFLLN